MAAMRHEDQFAPPRLSGRSAFSEETFAGGCGNEKDAPKIGIGGHLAVPPGIRVTYHGGSTGLC
jgi:hypothetical protein